MAATPTAREWDLQDLRTDLAAWQKWKLGSPGVAIQYL